MNDLEAFLSMGGYGAFVWGAYGVAALVIASFVVGSWRNLNRVRSRLEARDRRRER